MQGKQHTSQRKFWEVHITISPAKIAMASSEIAWICGQCTFKNDGSKPGPCHFWQVPHPKHKGVVVSMPTPAPVLPDAAALAVASVALTKPVCICQPAGSCPLQMRR